MHVYSYFDKIKICTYFFQIEVLTEVIDAVKNFNVEIFLDGGVTTGTDVFKALALGARMVRMNGFVFVYTLVCYCYYVLVMKAAGFCDLRYFNNIHIKFHNNGVMTISRKKVTDRQNYFILRIIIKAL